MAHRPYVKQYGSRGFSAAKAYKSFQAAKKQQARSGMRAGYTFVPRTRGAISIGENKYFDTNRSVAIPASADWTATELDPTTFNTLCVPVKGAGINERIGREIKVKKIKIQGAIRVSGQADQTSGDNAAICRLVLYQDEQTNASQAQGEQVFATQANANLNVHSFQSLDNFGRFRVLRDEKITVDNPNLSYDGTNVEQQGLATTFKMNYVFKTPVKIRFNSTNGGTIADIVDNSFHILGTTNSTQLAPTLDYVARVVYCE